MRSLVKCMDETLPQQPTERVPKRRRAVYPLAMPSNHERKGVCHATCQKKTSRAWPFRPSRHGNDLGAALHSTSVEEKPACLQQSGPDWHPQLRQDLDALLRHKNGAGGRRQLSTTWHDLAMASRRIVGISPWPSGAVDNPSMGNYHLQGKDGDFSAETKHTPGTFRDTSEQLQNGKLMVYDGVNLGQYMQKPPRR